MNILVTGHLGYIGTVLTPMLEKQGHNVIGLDNELFKNSQYGSFLPSIQMIKKDIRDSVADDLKKIDAVIHLAALSNDPLGDLIPEVTYDINYRATIALANLAKESGVKRFIFSSSCSNYGMAGDDFVDEKSKLAPVTPYALSKVKAEKILQQMADETFSPVYLRNATAYGYSPMLRFDLAVNNLTSWAYTTGEVYMKSDGSAWRPLVHVEDIAGAFVHILDAPRDLIHNEAFNVGSTQENYQIRDVAEMVKDIIPNSTLKFANGASADSRCYRVDCSKIEKILGFKTKWDVPSGIKQLYEAFQKTKLTLDQFEGIKYKRIDHLKKLLEEGKVDKNLRIIP
jgi:nucleoside-diphosphate-sugar epimerase